MKVDTSTYQITEEPKTGRRALLIGVVALLLSGVGLLLQRERFFYSYLTAVVFWATIGTGALFFVMLHHLVSARWSVVLRRLTENLMALLPVMAILFIPLFFGIHSLYHWSHPEAVAQNSLLQHKAGYLNTPFFIIRTVLYFGIWAILSWRLLKVSVEQDHQPGETLTARMKRLSAAGMVLFAFTLSFAGFDWIMSMQASWYSTIFGVYVFSGSVLAILAALTLVAIYLHERGILTEAITAEHYHDLGKLLFGFTIFWAYIAFSQLLLIWYANIPEETQWYRLRWEDPSWRMVSIIILFGHFVVPFLALITRAAKRNVKILKGVALWLLFMHFVDIYWLILPNYGQQVDLSWMDLTTVVGVGGIFVWYFWKQAAKRPLIPANDPRLQESVNFVNQ